MTQDAAIVGFIAMLGAGAVLYWLFFYKEEDELE
jgi:hypothetical protein